MKVTICGIPHEVIECEDSFTATAVHFGEIDYKKCLIKIASDLSDEHKEEALCHEIIHGILVHLGYDEQSQDEQSVQALGNAINQTFVVR